MKKETTFKSKINILPESYTYGIRNEFPATARFTTPDPIKDGFNWYAYCNNDPVNWTDVWGLNAGDGENRVE